MNETFGREQLKKKLGELGLSRRHSLRLLNFIFHELAAALARGEQVEFPFGKLERVRHKHRKTEGHFANGISTTYKRPFTVAHVLDGNGKRLLEPKPRRPRVVLPPKPWLRTGK
jgi:nucleoid DNA-binding protein